MKLIDQTIDHWIERAKQIASAAHEGQTRKGGEAYINHPGRIAAKVEKRLQPIAWLHDVVEDSDITINDLKSDGFPTYVLDAVSVLTHKDAVPNEIYWSEILKNPDAIEIKLHDIQDNLAGTPSEYAKQKYAKALNLFKKAGYTIDGK